MKKEKAIPRHRKGRTFSLHSTATNHANDETEEKEEHLQFFFHPQNKTTENLNLRIKEANSRILKKNVNLHFHFNDAKTYLMSHRRELDYRLLIQV